MGLPVSTSRSVTVTINTTDVLPTKLDMAGRPLQSIAMLATFLEAAAGALPLATTVGAQVSTVAAAQASGTLTLSTASGTVGGTINGVTITVTASGGDTATAVLIANAINASANALVAGIVSATSAGAVVTIKALQPGKLGNAITLAQSGTGVTASGARFTGGTGADATFSSITF